ncbi:MAG TPA: helix-turn-helix domain-containing protein [Firmicutes bacterium]|nr:helix-turn-helix domain-containing protein [Bacillota bacterium]
MKKHVGEKLKECRLACELTQKEVARRLGVSQPVYNRYEKGICECTYLQLSRLCDIFDVSADYILGRQDY